MHRRTGLFALLLVAGSAQAVVPTWEDRRARAERELETAGDEEERFVALPEAAKSNFEVGRLEEAARLARELLELAPRHDDWSQGNAVHDGHMVLGRVALRAGQLALAKGELLEAGATPGSPQLNSFGPNVALASDLLERGERAVVLEYFKRCERFWEQHEGSPLKEWREAIAAGELPEFGPNLVY